MMSRVPCLGLASLPEKALVVGATSRGGSEPTRGAGRFLAGLVDQTIKSWETVAHLPARRHTSTTLYVKKTRDGTGAGPRNRAKTVI